MYEAALRFGVMAVFGTPIMPAHVITQGEYIQNIVTIWKSSKASENYVEWVESNPEAAEILAYAESLVNGNG